MAARRGPARRTYVLLLRGINVGGARPVPMERLRAICEAAGCGDVRTYIQSGNVVCTSTATEAALVGDLEERIAAATGFEVAVVARTARELAHVVAANPFPGADPIRPVVAFLPRAPSARAVAAIDPSAYEPERFAVEGRDVYLSLPNGQGRAKLTPAVLEKAFGLPATARNWKTVTTLVSLAVGT